MIEYENGHWRSVRTPQEGTGLLEKDLETLSSEERTAIELIMAELQDPSQSAGLLQTIGNLEWLRTPVDMQTFVMDPFYLGNTCDNLYPRLMEDLTTLFDEGYREAIFTGAIGWGKTFAASIGICRLLYILSCMRDPHRSFGIAANSNISIVCLSVNEILATKVAYENIATKIEASPYFQENFPFEKTKKELRFPRKVWVAARASNDGSVLGLNVIGGLLDECVPVGSLVLLGDGEQAKVETLVGRTDVVVETFDFELGHAVPAQAFVKWSSEQPCYELELDNGMVMRGSADHPVAIRQDDGTFTFNVIGAIMDGQEVVVHAPMDGGAPESSFGEDEGPMGGGSVQGSRDESRGPREADLGGQADARGGEGVRPTPDGRGRQPDVWDAALRLAERAHRRSEQRAEVVRGGPQAHVRATHGEAGSLSSVQGRVGRAQPSAQGQVQAHRGDQAEDLRVEHLETPQGGLPLLGLGRDNQGWARWFPQSVRIESHRVVGGGLLCDAVRVREVGDLLLVEWEDAPHGAGLPGMGGQGSCDRGQASGIHLPLEREDQDGGRAGLLRKARLGLRSLGRELSVARVVSKRDVGVQPTYDVSVPGYECFVVDGTLVHNTNFMPKASKGQDPRFNLQDRAEVLYNAMQRRMKSRFERKGRLPGILFVVSSKQTNDDFTAKRIKEATKDPTVFARDYALWDVKPDIYYSGEWFHVVVGNEQAPSRILAQDEDVDEVKVTLPEDCVVIEVPEDFRGDFENDLEGAIRDLAGVATVSVSPYIQRRTKIIDAIRKDMRHPFSVQVYDPSQPGRFYWHKMLRAADDAEGGQRPILSPYAPRHIHIDPSMTGDSTGFAMGHVSGWREVVRRDDEGNRYPERAPEITIDVVLRIVPPIGGEIILGDVRKLVYQLGKHGYMITCVSIDSWNSADAIQKLNQRGYNAIQLSVDRTMGPYDLVKSALYEDRLYYYEYEPLLQELRELEHDRLKRKVDHPLRGSKDTADAVAGVVWTLTENSSSLPLAILKSLPDHGDAWMLEHQQSALARSYGSEDVSDMSDGLMALPPFLVGSEGGWES